MTASNGSPSTLHAGRRSATRVLKRIRSITPKRARTRADKRAPARPRVQRVLGGAGNSENAVIARLVFVCMPGQIPLCAAVVVPLAAEVIAGLEHGHLEPGLEGVLGATRPDGPAPMTAMLPPSRAASIDPTFGAIGARARRSHAPDGGAVPARGERRRGYSYARASSTSMRAARRAGSTAASTPASTATTVKATSAPAGSPKARPTSPHSGGHQRGEPEPGGHPQRRAEQGGDDRLVADHPPHLPAGHPTARRVPSSRVRSNVESTSALTRPNRRHDHGQRQEHVEDAQQRVDRLGLRVDVGARRLHLDLRMAGEGLRQPPRRRRGRRRTRTARVPAARAWRGLLDRDRARGPGCRSPASSRCP